MDTAVLRLSEEPSNLIELFSREAWTEMRQTNSLSDTILQTEDGGTFIVHRSILCLCSPYFKVLFTTKIKKVNRKWFTIPGVDSYVLKTIVDYAYTGKIIVTEENVADLLIGADQFNVLGLLKDCCDFLLFNLTYNNCINIKKFASAYFCFELVELVDRFLIKHFVEISEQSKEFLCLSLEEVMELLNSDRLNIKGEEQVWEAGLRWIDYLPEERKRNTHLIMRCVRLGLLDTQYFLDNVKPHKYVENNELCKKIVIDTLKFLWDLEMMDQKTEKLETPFLAIPRIPSSILFTIGGWNGGAASSLIETYDTKADRWVQVEENDPAGPRAYHKLAVIGHKIYAIGGFNGEEYFSSCRCYDIATKQWKEIAPMHSKRCYVSIAVLNNLIYAMGGYDGHHRQNTAERYDYHTNQWTHISPMNVQRSDACATSLNNLIYIVGGFNGVECLASCELYNPVFDQWTNITSLRHRRSGVAIISHHGKIYALGGFNGISRLSSGERYDPDTEEWTDIPDMFNPRSNFAIEIIDDMVFAMGGFNGVSTICHVECFNDLKNEWLEATDMNHVRSALAACVVHDLTDVSAYIHPNRKGLMEEKRQKLLQQRNLERERARFGLGLPRFHPHMIRENEENE